MTEEDATSLLVSDNPRVRVTTGPFDGRYGRLLGMVPGFANRRHLYYVQLEGLDSPNNFGLSCLMPVNPIAMPRPDPSGDVLETDGETISCQIRTANPSHASWIYNHLSAFPMPHPSGDGRIPSMTSWCSGKEGSMIITVEFPRPEPAKPTLAELADAWLADMGNAPAREAFWKALVDGGCSIEISADGDLISSMPAIIFDNGAACRAIHMHGSSKRGIEVS